MIGSQKEYIGKRLDWDQLSTLFPDRFVALDQYRDDGHSVSGVLVFVGKTRQEVTPVLREWADKGNKLSCLYTTESMIMM